MRYHYFTICLSLLVAQGCGSNSPEYYETNKAETEVKQESEKAKIDVVADECRDQFRRAFDASNPEMMGLQADRNSSLLFLREWQRECSGKLSSTINLDSVYLEQNLGKDSLEYAIKKEFDGRDVTHIRDAQLCFKLANFACQKAKGTLDKVLILHEFAVNSVAITPGFENTVPRSCFEILKFGRGNKNDRVWIFANLLRQLHLDAFLIVGKPGKDAEGQSVNPLIGVLIDGQTYLFDVLCSAPIPAVDDPRQAFVTKPATLEELQANPQLLEGMFTGVKTFHPLASYDFSAPRILLISTASFYAPRMKDIQQEMTGLSQAIVYDDLTGSDNAHRDRIFHGLKQKVKLESIGIWSYPETMTVRFENPDANDMAALKQWDSPFEMTTETIRTSQDVNENVQKILTKEKQFLQARINQLNGHTDEALSSYGRIRLINLVPVTPEDNEDVKREKLLTIRMSIDSSYWIAVAQTQNQKHRTAYENSLIFVGRYPYNEFTPAAITLASTSLAHENRMSDAFDVLEKNLSPDKDPDFNRSLFYYVWWGLKLHPEKFQSSKTPPENTPEKPATDSTSNMKDEKKPLEEKNGSEKSADKTEANVSPTTDNKSTDNSEKGKQPEKQLENPEKPTIEPTEKKGDESQK